MLLRDGGEDVFHLHAVEVVLRLVIESDGATRCAALFRSHLEGAEEKGAAEALPRVTGGANERRRQDGASGGGAAACGRGIQAAASGLGIHVSVIPAGAVIPKHGHGAFGGVVFQPPVEEVGEHLRITGIGLAELHEDIFFHRRALLHAVAIRGNAARSRVPLHEDVHAVGGAGFFYLADVIRAEVIEVVVPGHVNEDGPVRLGGSGRGGGFFAHGFQR